MRGGSFDQCRIEIYQCRIALEVVFEADSSRGIYM